MATFRQLLEWKIRVADFAAFHTAGLQRPGLERQFSQASCERTGSGVYHFFFPRQAYCNMTSV